MEWVEYMSIDRMLFVVKMVVLFLFVSFWMMGLLDVVMLYVVWLIVVSFCLVFLIGCLLYDWL